MSAAASHNRIGRAKAATVCGFRGASSPATQQGQHGQCGKWRGGGSWFPWLTCAASARHRAAGTAPQCTRASGHVPRRRGSAGRLRQAPSLGARIRVGGFAAGLRGGVKTSLTGVAAAMSPPGSKASLPVHPGDDEPGTSHLPGAVTATENKDPSAGSGALSAQENRPDEVVGFGVARDMLRRGADQARDNVVAALDVDDDGDVDLKDVFLISKWLWRCVSLLFDVTYSAIPIGALIGTVLATGGSALVVRSVEDVAVILRPLVSKVDGFQGFDDPRIKEYVGIGLLGIWLVDVFTVLHGFAAGALDARRTVGEFKDDWNSGVENGRGSSGTASSGEGALAAQTTGSSNSQKRWCLACLGWMVGTTFQAVWALVGTVVLCASIGLAYAISVGALAFYVAALVAAHYIEDASAILTMAKEMGDKGLQAAKAALSSANSTLATATAAHETASNVAESLGGATTATTGAASQAATATSGAASQAAAAAAPVSGVASAAASGAAAATSPGHLGTLIAYSEGSEAKMMYQLSALGQILKSAEAMLPMASGWVGIGEQLLAQGGNFTKLIVEDLQPAVKPLPPPGLRIYVGVALVLVGQIWVLVFHQKYFVKWCYEQRLARDRAEKTKQ